MAYIALYRKKRPKNFDGVIGQEHIVKTLTNQIQNKRITHAYLFCGTRGTGKTSTAKIFAKAINCLEPINGQPCGECELCKAIDNGRSMNVIEIDAASNNGVDNIRDIREEVKYPPTEGNYKVYIIDEVHMLSLGAFNALLKTLEEPPAHVVFILATTDPQKIPVTILSRCQRFDFRRITSKEMVKAMKEYMSEEGVLVDDEALEYIARASDGAMRDALSILDQCMAFYYGERITLEKVLEVSGAVDDGVLFDMAESVFLCDSERCMEIIDDVIMRGCDIVQFVSNFIVHLRNILVAMSVDKNSSALETSSEKRERLLAQGEKTSKIRLIELVNNFSELQNSLKYSLNPRVVTEVYVIKMCNPITSDGLGSLISRLENVERELKNGVREVVREPEATDKEVKEKKPKPPAIPEDFKTVIGAWKDFSENFDEFEKAFLQQTKPECLDDKFYIVCPSKVHLSKLDEIKDKVLAELEKRYGKKFELSFILEEDYKVKASKYDMSEREEEGSFEEDIAKAINSEIIWD